LITIILCSVCFVVMCLLSCLFGSCDMRVCMVGLDCSGKTTILNQLKFGKDVETLPTFGCNFQKFKQGNVRMSVFDLGGQERLRQLWPSYMSGMQALIFVVDCCAPDRIAAARQALDAALQHDSCRVAPVLIYANKQDLPGAMSVSELSQALGLHELRDGSEVLLQSASAKSGEGLQEGVSQLCAAVRRAKA